MSGALWLSRVACSTILRCRTREVEAMAMSIRVERSLVSHDEGQILGQTHYPALYDVSSDELVQTRVRLRDLRSKERTLSRDLRRGISGKGEPRGSSYPGNLDKPTKRKQVFASALKRVNGELTRRRVIAARESMQASAERALGLKGSKKKHHPLAGRRSRFGMNSIENDRRRASVPPSKVGSVTKSNQVAQAAKDSRV